MTAHDAQQLTIDAVTRKMEEIVKLIEEAAGNGRVSVIVTIAAEHMRNEINTRLINRCFTVEIDRRKRLKISWKE